MRTAVLTALLALLSASALGAPAPRPAREVVVRGGGDLARLVSAATMEAWKDRANARPVAVVIDATPHTIGAKLTIRAAFDALGDRISHLDGSWSVGALGRKLEKPVKHPSALAPLITRVLAGETSEVNTFRALRRSVSGFTDRGGVVLYLADWRFEDDDGLESFASMLRARDQSFFVIGSEACFSRAWNDGIPWFAFGEEYEEGIGRNPFGPRRAEAPWHGGDTAYPHAPYTFGSLPWKTEFPLSVQRDRLLDGPGDFEDLAERINGAREENVGFRTYPLASSFGPYALMRVAAVTGGKYYLHSFNPGGRVSVVYDYAKCNLFEPDLRSRREVLADTRSKPLPAAILKTWHQLADVGTRIVNLTPPLKNGGTPNEIRRIPPGDDLRLVWKEKSDRDGFLAEVEKRLGPLDASIRRLARVLAAPTPARSPEIRYHADARLLHHTLRVLHFQLVEAREAARAVPASAWTDGEGIPAITSRPWILAGSDPEHVAVGRVRPYRPEEGEKIKEERVRHLTTYGGTPFGEIVARNSVVTYRFTRVPDLEKMPNSSLGRTPSESNREPRETPPDRGGRPGGASGGGGPSSGK